MQEIINSFLVCDEEVFREGYLAFLATNIYLQVIGACSSLSEAIEILSDDVFVDVLVINLQYLRSGDIASLINLHIKYPSIRIALICPNMHAQDLVQLPRAGVFGIMEEPLNQEQCFAMIRAIHTGMPYYSRRAAFLISQQVGRKIVHANTREQERNIALFTLSEIRIMQLICEQQSTKEIATSMYLATRTVEGYRKNIEDKIGARNVAGIVCYAIAHGLFTLT